MENVQTRVLKTPTGTHHGMEDSGIRKNVMTLSKRNPAKKTRWKGVARRDGEVEVWSFKTNADRHLSAKNSNAESKGVELKMKGDYYRHPAEGDHRPLRPLYDDMTKTAPGRVTRHRNTAQDLRYTDRHQEGRAMPGNQATRHAAPNEGLDEEEQEKPKDNIGEDIQAQPRTRKRVFFGPTNSPSIFHHKVTKVFTGLKGCITIHDNRLVYGANEKEHNKNMEAMLERAKTKDVTPKPSKSTTCKPEVKRFGRVIVEAGASADPDKTQHIVQAGKPETSKNVRSLLQAAAYNAKYGFNHKEDQSYEEETGPLQTKATDGIETDATDGIETDTRTSGLYHTCLSHEAATERRNLARNASGTTVLYRDEVIYTHSYVQTYIESIKGYGKKMTEVHSYVQTYIESIKGYGKKMTEVKEGHAVALAQRIQTTTVTTEEDNGTRQMRIETTSPRGTRVRTAPRTGDQMTTAAARGLAPDDRRPNDAEFIVTELNCS